MRVDIGNGRKLDIADYEVETALSILRFLAGDNNYADTQAGIEEARQFIDQLDAEYFQVNGPIIEDDEEE